MIFWTPFVRLPLPAKALCLWILAGFLPVPAFSQELNFKVVINTPALQTADPKVFTAMKSNIEDLLNSTKWTEDAFETGERILGTLQITIKEELPPSGFKADFLIQATRPVYGSNYETPLITHQDKDVVFNFEQFQPLQYVRNNPTDNLIAVLAFYAYVAIGLDYDSFSPMGGDPHFIQAQNLMVSLPPAVQGAPGWKPADSNRNRYWLLENILSPRLRNFRKGYYEYHRMGLDVMSDNKDAAKTTIANFMRTLDDSFRDYPNAMLLMLFANTKNNEIVEIFKECTQEQKQQMFTAMSKIDPGRISEYKRVGI